MGGVGEVTRVGDGLAGVPFCWTDVCVSELGWSPRVGWHAGVLSGHSVEWRVQGVTAMSVCFLDERCVSSLQGTK